MQSPEIECRECSTSQLQSTRYPQISTETENVQSKWEREIGALKMKGNELKRETSNSDFVVLEPVKTTINSTSVFKKNDRYIQMSLGWYARAVWWVLVYVEMKPRTRPVCLSSATWVSHNMFAITQMIACHTHTAVKMPSQNAVHGERKHISATLSGVSWPNIQYNSFSFPTRQSLAPFSAVTHVYNNRCKHSVHMNVSSLVPQFLFNVLCKYVSAPAAPNWGFNISYILIALFTGGQMSSVCSWCSWFLQKKNADGWETLQQEINESFLLCVQGCFALTQHAGHLFHYILPEIMTVNKIAIS